MSLHLKAIYSVCYIHFYFKYPIRTVLLKELEKVMGRERLPWYLDYPELYTTLVVFLSKSALTNDVCLATCKDSLILSIKIAPPSTKINCLSGLHDLCKWRGLSLKLFDNVLFSVLKTEDEGVVKFSAAKMLIELIHENFYVLTYTQQFLLVRLLFDFESDRKLLKLLLNEYQLKIVNKYEQMIAGSFVPILLHANRYLVCN